MTQKYSSLTPKMECHHFDSPISTLKVDFGSSKHCPTDVEKMLLQLKGVKSISINPSEGKVIVIGDVNPMKLVNLVQKMGKKVQLWSFDRSPKKGKSNCCCCESDTEEDDCDHDSHQEEEEEEDIRLKHKKSKAMDSQKGKKKKHWKDWFGFGSKKEVPNKSISSPSPPILGHYVPMPWNQPFINVGVGPSVYGGAYYSYCGRNQSVLNTYGQLSSRLLSKYNPMIQYTTYANNYGFPI